MDFREGAAHQASQCEAPSWGWSPWSLRRSIDIGQLSNWELFDCSYFQHVGIELQLLTMAAVTKLVVWREEGLMRVFFWR